jgi:hypothetical protein
MIKRQRDLGKKVPFTQFGITMVDTVMRKRLEIAKSNVFIDSYKTFPPLAEDIADNDKANRLLPNVPFEAVLALSVRKVIIRGYLTI